MSSRFFEALDARQAALSFVDGSRWNWYAERLTEELVEDPDENFNWVNIQDPAGALDRLRTSSRASLLHGPTFWWAQEMCEALDVLYKSLPDNPLDLNELVSPSGFFYYAKPIALGSSDKVIVATSWIFMAEDPGDTRFEYATRGEETGVVVMHYCRPPAGYIVPVTMSPWSQGMTAEGHYNKVVSIQGASTYEQIQLGVYTGMELLQLFMAAQLFVQQRVTSRVRMPLPRDAARRAERPRVKPEDRSSIQVVQLRRREQSASVASDGVPRSVDWSHRWWVGLSTAGFWRNQPTNEGVKRILIAPYVKGPDDLPLVTRGAVNTVVR